jgi:hypothetical protein
MTILVTGGTGRTGGAVARRLHEANVPFLILTRSGKLPAPYEANGCRFDFLDPSTFDIPFTTAKDTIQAIYLVVPMAISDDIAKPVNDFVDFSRRKGVRRFVLLSSNVFEPGERIVGAVHQHLLDLSDDVEYAIMRPTWYMGKYTSCACFQNQCKITGVLIQECRELQSQPSSLDQRKGHRRLGFRRRARQMDLDRRRRRRGLPSSHRPSA